MQRFIGFFVFLLFSSRLLAANDVVNTITQNTLSHNTALVSSLVSHAQTWNLTDAEWQKYQLLLQGINGHYYSQLTPPEVLGINAETLEDLKHFAELTAKQEHTKIEKELRFNVAFQAAAKQLYADEPLIKPFDLTPYTPVLPPP
jgi:integrating conjugative element protein (TIGR03759 family)